MVQAQAERREENAAPAETERGPVGLLRKLTHGLGAREAEPAPAPAKAAPAAEATPAVNVRPPAAPDPVQEREQAAPAVNADTGRRERMDDNPYAPKRASTDKNGRAAPAERTVREEDQLDIPAFLRRQTG